MKKHSQNASVDDQITVPSQSNNTFSVTKNSSGLPSRSRLFCMIALMSAAILAAIDTTIANTALPQIADELKTRDVNIIWVTNAYQISMIAGILPLAALGEAVGYRRVFMSGLCIFAGAAAICGASSVLPFLIVGRALQGLGAAGIMSVITAIIRHIYPPNMLGRALGTNALFVAIGFTFGPVLASIILSFTNWHWLFFINIPIALISFIYSHRYLPPFKGKHRAFEITPAFLCATFLGCVALALCLFENGGKSLFAAVAAFLACLSLGLLLRKERTHPAPMLALDLLNIRVVRLSALTSISAFSTQSLALVSLPFLMQKNLNISVIKTGFLIAAWPLVVAIMAPIVARISDQGRLPAGILCSVGLFFLATGMTMLALIPPEAGQREIVFRLALCGLGFGLFQAPNMREIMNKSPAIRSGGASGLVAISRLLGQTGGAALVAVCFRYWHTEGPHAALWLGAACALIGCVFSILRCVRLEEA